MADGKVDSFLADQSRQHRGKLKSLQDYAGMGVVCDENKMKGSAADAGICCLLVALPCTVVLR